MVVSKKRREIIPNETKWAPSRKGREKLAGKEYSLRSSEDLANFLMVSATPGKRLLKNLRL